ncbi:hypothetical protein J3L18_21015 [Mucilaginibacter gossypii]|uniref:hypothetical protein n=1 Tax=Mucilaginibacter gossypii TaxID=551996 RepID=UPI000DCBEE4F|nr:MULTISPECIES: hypothetical protein [Mucilaginibacter]QTE35616.1 hypothetical protein J3L18_21015 [Mucilaginibacter gossypii]RAV47643.1 hypothetical protein DIU36_29275 [Mucilaginibacter rubeus]
MKKLTILTFVAASIAFASCHSADKNNRQNDTSVTQGSGGPADSAKTSTARNTDTTTNSADTTTLHGDTDSAVHPVH